MKVRVTRTQRLDIEVPDGMTPLEAKEAAVSLGRSGVSQWRGAPATYAPESGAPHLPWVVPDEPPSYCGLKLGACYALGEPLPHALNMAMRDALQEWGLAGRTNDAGPAAIWTGETRPPLAGEWMLCSGGGYRTAAHMAKGDLSAPFPIARLVMVRRRRLAPSVEGYVMIVTPLDAPEGGGE